MGFWPILGLWHFAEFQARAENTRTQFAAAMGTLMEKNGTTLSGIVFHNFLAKYFFFAWCGVVPSMVEMVPSMVAVAPGMGVVVPSMVVVMHSRGVGVAPTYRLRCYPV